MTKLPLLFYSSGARTLLENDFDIEIQFHKLLKDKNQGILVFHCYLFLHRSILNILKNVPVIFAN